MPVVDEKSKQEVEAVRGLLPEKLCSRTNVMKIFLLVEHRYVMLYTVMVFKPL